MEDACGVDLLSFVPQTPSESGAEVWDELPYPSCFDSGGSRQWNPDLFPFDVETLSEKCFIVSRLLNLDVDGNQEKGDEAILQSAKELHQRR
ncbi:unnamed protein product [Linum trigynum]|uniref:Uncharacterized protein n=1 Tax=Linum trigynum TaxID=586398 RepID=A0AAV2E243_9ROSI